MKSRYFLVFILLTTIFCTCSCNSGKTEVSAEGLPDSSVTVSLPEPRYDSDVSLEESLLARRSVREFSSEPLSLEIISQLLWAAQGITDKAGHRTAPSAIAIYPLSIYVVVGNVPEIVPGVYIYDPSDYSIERIIDGDIRDSLSEAAMGQTSVRQGAVSFVITADFGLVMSRFGEKGERFATLEAGHATQNLCLQAAALDIGVVTAGAIDDEKIAAVLELPDNLTPLYVVPAGKKR